MADSNEGTLNGGHEEINGENREIGKREALKQMKRKQLVSRNEERLKLRRIKAILRKEVGERNGDELEFLHRYSKVASEVLRRKEKKKILDERTKEKQDSPEELREKCDALAEAIRSSKHMVVYTGAGISTAASIPDYRGPDGVWTKLSKGEDYGSHDICNAEPTLTHMSLVELYQQSKIKHVVSQNCDGLHIRSGLPPESLSEVHGNMFVEVCEDCEPQRVYWRLFDVTENTGLRRHRTMRKCHYCHRKLSDSIVHFGEKRQLSYPQNWEAAFDHAKETDTILCLGSSLKVLKSYRALWGMNRVKTKRPSLFIVNLQWTPKDSIATLKINGKVDDVFRLIMEKLGYRIPTYCRSVDPLFSLHTPLTRYEMKSHSANLLSVAIKSEKIEEDFSTERYRLDNICLKEERSIKYENFITKDEKQEDCKTAVLRPGWFGKGLRKVRKRKLK